MRKQLGIMMLGIFLLFIAAGCNSGRQGEDPSQKTESGTKTAFPVTVTDSLHRQVTVGQEPQKIISLSPAITEILFALGVEEKIVGVTDFCDYPAAALDKPKVGGFENPNLEVIINSGADVIFAAAGIQQDLVKQFEDLGLLVVTLDAENVEQVLDNIRLAGLITGAGQRAEELTQSLQERIDAVVAKTAAVQSKPKVFFEVWDNPLMSAGPGSFINDLIQLAGGENIAADLTERFGEFSQELLLERNPEIYIINNHAHQPEDIKTRAGYEGLQAVKMNQVFSIEDDIVTLPGPRIVDGLEAMAAIIHPELFP